MGKAKIRPRRRGGYRLDVPRESSPTGARWRPAVPTDLEALARVAMRDDETLDALVAAVFAKARAQESKAITLSKHLDDWLERVEVECADATYKQRKRTLAKHVRPPLGHLALDEITDETIERFSRRLRRAGLSATTVNAILSVLRTAFGAAVEWHRIDRAPKIRFLPVDEADPDYLTPETRDALIEACDSAWLRVCVALCALAGLRISEALSLEWRDVLWHQGTSGRLHIRKTKTRKPRTVSVCAALRRELRAAQRIGVPFVVCKPDGSRISRVTAWRHLQRVAEAAKIDTVEGVRLCSGDHKAWHVLRHSFASHLVQAGKPLYDVAKLLGHSAMRHTTTYAHLAPTQLDDAVGVLDRRSDDDEQKAGER